MRRQPIILVCALGSVLGGCAGVDQPAMPESQPTVLQSQPAGPDAPPSATPFDLYTHCGIRELRTDDGRFFERVGGPLDDPDSGGNPPPGWGNPSQGGQITVTDDLAVFTDDVGHREEFRLREGETEFLMVCA